MSRAPFASSSSWASDLCRPLPMVTVGLLVVNDHLLKGSGVLPGWLTGKVSDFAGLFFFPLLLAAMARGSSCVLLRRDIEDRQALAFASALATGAAFAAIKLCAPINAQVARTWGVMQMDPTDLWALSVLPLAAAYMLRTSPRDRLSKAPHRAPSPARRWLDLAGVWAAALASVATSSPPPPPPVAPPQPMAEIASPPAVAAAAAPDTCASLSLSVCERSANRTFVVVEASGAGPGSCEIVVSQAREVAGDVVTSAERLPSRLVVKEGETATFSLSFLRPVAPEEAAAGISLELDVLRAHDVSEAAPRILPLYRACASR